MKSTFVFEVTIGLKNGGAGGMDDLNWERINVLADNAKQAIKKAEETFNKDDILAGVKMVCSVDIV